MIKSLGVEIKLNSRVGKDIAFEKIKKDFDAVFVATGADKGWTLGIPGEDLDGVYDAITFLKDVNLGVNTIKVGEKVAVVGGGNAAIDAARTALRLGAKKVTIVYRRLKDDMPAAPEEIHEAELEGIEIRYLAVPIEAIGENGKLKSLKCQLLELGEFDKSGRRKPEADRGQHVRSAGRYGHHRAQPGAGRRVTSATRSRLKQRRDRQDRRRDDEDQRGRRLRRWRRGERPVDGDRSDRRRHQGRRSRSTAISAGPASLLRDTANIEIPPAPEDVDDIVETPRVCENMLVRREAHRHDRGRSRLHPRAGPAGSRPLPALRRGTRVSYQPAAVSHCDGVSLQKPSEASPLRSTADLILLELNAEG